jgi:biopolymer transport protein ExbD
MRDLSANINTTPLVDVMLVLLIIFMIAAPLVESEESARLPRPSEAPSEHAPFRLTILEGSLLRVRFNEREHSGVQAISAIKYALQGLPTARVMLSAEENANYHHLTSMLGLLRGAGVESVAIAVD